MEPRKEIVNIYSFDYDGCMDIFFHPPCTPAHIENFNKQEQCIKEMRDYLTNAGKGVDKEEVYCGSIRQDIFRDELNMKDFQNGSCFENYAKLCREKGWVFRELLLADNHNGEQPGTAMRDKSLRFKNLGSRAQMKIAILEAQIEDIKKNHPNAIVRLFFFDDDMDNEIFPDLLRHFDSIAEPLDQLTFIKFNWQGAIYENDTILEEIRVIKNLSSFGSSTAKLIHLMPVGESTPAITPTQIITEEIQPSHMEPNIKPMELLQENLYNCRMK